MILHWAVDESGRILLNEIGRNVTGFLHRTINDFEQFLHDDDRERAYKAFIESSFAQKPYKGDFRIRCADGEYRLCSVVGDPVVFQDRYIGYRGTLRINYAGAQKRDLPAFVLGLINEDTA